MREHRGPLDFRRQQPVAKDSNVQGQGRCLLPFFQELSFLLDLLEAKADVPVTGRREASCHSGFCAQQRLQSRRLAPEPTTLECPPAVLEVPVSLLHCRLFFVPL